ncbi:uncharacterized protein LOC127812088 isoform X2 [Diospyros lotus]|uniref:uncharacterized protein LOC127812088 isoform X2 n=1 Tax=Diospyros lotus TaxID=55363 RepID=UPI0022502FC4|nr:uncharacterized protein LOC127812088 isoform X2 [Diospyros lotus]
MAFRVARHFWRSSVPVKATEGRSFASSAGNSVHSEQPKRGWRLKADLAPIYMVAGMVAVAVSIAAHTAKQQLFHAPAVQVSKKRRESVQEVEDPHDVVRDSDKFINKSFLRKVAHIQDQDPIGPNPFTRSREIESLKSAGVHKN